MVSVRRARVSLQVALWTVVGVAPLLAQNMIVANVRETLDSVH